MMLTAVVPVGRAAGTYIWLGVAMFADLVLEGGGMKGSPSPLEVSLVAGKEALPSR